MTLSSEPMARMARDHTAAWNSSKPEAVAAFFEDDGEIVINRGDPWFGRSRIAEMAAGFFAVVPDLSLTCDDLRLSGSHANFIWNFTGHDAESGKPSNVRGWEEWDLSDDLKVRKSCGWFDADDYARQVAEG